MQATVEKWCSERLDQAGVPWPLLQVFIAKQQCPALLAGQALIYAVQASLTSSDEPDIVRHKLAWWQTELRQHATSVHPAFIALRETGLSNNWDWQTSNDWCNDLQFVIEPNAPEDIKAMWQQASKIAGNGMGLLIAAMQQTNDNNGEHFSDQCKKLASINTACWLLQQVNRLSIDINARRWIPLSLRARYILRIDENQISSEKNDGLSQAVIEILNSIAQSLQASEMILKTLAANGRVDNCLLRLLAMQRLLGLQTAKQLHQSASQLWQQPVKTLGLSSAWYCWRAVRQLSG